MEKEDKVAIGLLLAVIGTVAFGLMWAIKVTGAAVFGWFVGADTGVGFKDAFIAAIILSTVLLVLFTLVAGDGFLGELPTMIIGFFLFILFFTFSIAWVF